MYTSTEEYLQALRNGDYLRALQWVDFLAYRYTEPHSKFDADTTLILATFELINHGFSREDLPAIQVLYALLCEPVPVLTGKIGYAATVLCNAAMQYLVYLEHDLLAEFRTDKPLNISTIYQLMEENKALLAEDRNSEALMGKYSELHHSLPESQKVAAKIALAIHAVMVYQNYIKEYIDKLSTLEDPDGLAAVRLGLAMSLQSKTQTLISADFIKNNLAFIGKIRELEPLDWEEDFLSKLQPKPFSQWLLDKSTQKCRFFAARVLGNLLPTLNVGAKNDSDLGSS